MKLITIARMSANVIPHRPPRIQPMIKRIPVNTLRSTAVPNMISHCYIVVSKSYIFIIFKLNMDLEEMGITRENGVLIVPVFKFNTFLLEIDKYVG